MRFVLLSWLSLPAGKFLLWAINFQPKKPVFFYGFSKPFNMAAIFFTTDDNPACNASILVPRLFFDRIIPPQATQTSKYHTDKALVSTIKTTSF
jgi:hypothetical protein